MAAILKPLNSHDSAVSLISTKFGMLIHTGDINFIVHSFFKIDDGRLPPFSKPLSHHVSPTA